MKHVLLTALLAICSLSISYADCTVTTDCRTSTFEENVSATIDNNGDVVISSQDGQVVETYNCPQGGVSVSCSSGDNNPNVAVPAFDICDFVPSFLKSFFGCN